MRFGGHLYTIKITVSLCLITVTTISASAYDYNDYLNPQEYITRCFQSIGNIRLSFKDPRRAGIQSMDQAITLCEKLIEAPKLNNTSGNIYSSDPAISITEAREVVRRFQQVHEYWFGTDKYEDVMQESGKTKMLYDTAQPAAYFTYAFFNTSPDYKRAVTLSDALQLKRGSTNPPISNRHGTAYHTTTGEVLLETFDHSNSDVIPSAAVKAILGVSASSPGKCYACHNTDQASGNLNVINNSSLESFMVRGNAERSKLYKILTGGTISIGTDPINNINYTNNQMPRIVGATGSLASCTNNNSCLTTEQKNTIRDWINSYKPKMITTNNRGMVFGISKIPSTSDASKTLSSRSESQFQPINRFEHLGGGFLGSPSFILLNFGLETHKIATGSLTLPRRIGKNIMDVAFCRSGPYLKTTQIPTSDITAPAGNTGSAPGFRTNTNCMSCHSTQDPLSFTYRNFKSGAYDGAFEKAEIQSMGYKRCIKTDSSGECNGETNPGSDINLIERVKNSQMSGSTPDSPTFQWPWISDGLSDFAFRKNFKSRLLFTSAFDGQVSESFVESLSGNYFEQSQFEQLGASIAANKDYYLCGALKYTEMLFGTKLEIKTEHLPNLQNSADSFQVNLWNNLKSIITTSFNSSTSNPKTLLKKLIQTPEFKSRSFGKRPPIQSVSISGIQPVSGPAGQSTSINLFGTNFGSGTTVQIGGQPCNNVTIVSSSQLSCQTPAIPDTGSVTVIVNRNGYSSVLPDGYKYISQLSWNGGIKNIFQNCTGCHGGSSPQNGLNFSTYNGLFPTINPLTSAQCNESTPHSIFSISNGVISQNSILVQKIAPSGNMNVHLDDDAAQTKYNLIIQWLQLGAPEN